MTRASKALSSRAAAKPTTGAWLLAADAKMAAGDAAKAKEYGQKAVDTAQDPRQKEAIKMMTEKFGKKKPEGSK
jgi:hypothetical protein